MRVVSLVPSVTETLLAWGITPVGVTRFCEQPTLTAVGGTKDPDIAAIVALHPDVVVMDEEENLRQHAEELERAGVDVLGLAVRAVGDVGVQIARLHTRVQATTPWVPPSVLIPVSGPRVRAFIPIWRRPWMTLTGDTYGSSILGVVGVDNVFADGADRYPTITLDDVMQRQPDVILLPTEPYPFTERRGVDELSRLGLPVITVDGKDLFWWGTRTAGAVQRLAGVVQGRLR